MSNEKPLAVIAGSPDKPIVIAGTKVQCYVLEGGIRVLSQRGVFSALGRARMTRNSMETGIPAFLSAKNLRPFISDRISMETALIRFKAPGSGTLGYGYRAELLPETCRAYLAARRAGALHPNQLHLARQAEILLSALAVVGIIGLIDEHTGYEQSRERRELAKILERFLNDEYKRWTRMFPYEYYEHIVRLKKWPARYIYDRPHEVAHITNDVVYGRLAPGLVRELRVRNPMLPTGQRAQKHHQWFNSEHGHPELETRLREIILLMKAARTWAGFMHSLNMTLQRYDTQLGLGYPEDYEQP